MSADQQELYIITIDMRQPEGERRNVEHFDNQQDYLARMRELTRDSKTRVYEQTGTKLHIYDRTQQEPPTLFNDN